MFKFHLMFQTICVLVLHSANAQPAAVVTLHSVADRVRSQNPDIAAARLVIDEAIGRLKGAGRLDNPELKTSPRYNASSSERGIEVALSQRFPVTARLKLERDHGLTEVESARHEIREVENQLIGRAKAAMVRVLASRERKALLEGQSRLSSELAEHLAAAVKRGEVPALDAGEVQIEGLRMQAESRRAGVEERQAIGELKPLLGMEPGEALEIAGSLPGLELPDGTDPGKRPALEVARLAVVAAEQSAAIERARRVGDVTAGVVAAAERSIDEPSGAENEGIIGFEFSIPLPLWNRNEGGIEAAEARAERRRKEVLALRRHVELEAEAARAEMLDWAKIAADIEQVLMPRAVEQSGLAERSWRAAQADLSGVLRSREQVFELSTSRLDALQDFHLARVRYETALGNH